MFVLFVVVVVVVVVADEVLAAFHFPSSSGKTVIVRNLLTYHSRYITQPLHNPFSVLVGRFCWYPHIKIVPTTKKPRFLNGETSRKMRRKNS